MHIQRNIQKYLKNRQSTARYASFDYCFNYFQKYRDAGQISKIANPNNLQFSCLQLSFYLASMGMLRGGSELMRKSVSYYIPMIKAIASTPAEAWEIDANYYTESNIEVLIEIADQIRGSLIHKPTDALVTKIMLGVFGNVPALDTSFRLAFGATKLNADTLRTIGVYYSKRAQIVEKHRVPTLEFGTGKPTRRKYTRAKVIDMIFFQEGSDKEAKSKSQ